MIQILYNNQVIENYAQPMKFDANLLSETNYIMIPERLGAKYAYLSICK